MAKKATGKSGATTGKQRRKRGKSEYRGCARVFGAAAAIERKQDEFDAGEAFIKLLQSPLVAELVAVAATAALASLAEHGFTSGSDGDARQARRQGGEGSRQGRGGRGRSPARHRNRRDPEGREAKGGAKA